MKISRAKSVKDSFNEVKQNLKQDCNKRPKQE